MNTWKWDTETVKSWYDPNNTEKEIMWNYEEVPNNELSNKVLNDSLFPLYVHKFWYFYDCRTNELIQ